MPSSEVLHTARGDFQLLTDGPLDGPPVVLLHGFPELNLSWRHQLPALAGAGYRVVAPNQRGYPGSVSDGSYATTALADDAVAILDALSIPSAVIVGHDWGGGVAWTVAGRHPERVSALAVLNCPPPQVLARHLVRSPRQLAKSWYMLFFQLPVLPERFVSKGMPGMIVGGSFNRKAWDRASLTPYAEAFATPAQARGPVNWYRGAFREGMRGAGRHQARVDVPVLVIWGTQDRFLGVEMVSASSLASTLAPGNSAELVQIDSAGHYVQNEAPDEVNSTLLRWLAER